MHWDIIRNSTDSLFPLQTESHLPPFLEQLFGSLITSKCDLQSHPKHVYTKSSHVTSTKVCIIEGLLSQRQPYRKANQVTAQGLILWHHGNMWSCPLGVGSRASLTIYPGPHQCQNSLCTQLVSKCDQDGSAVHMIRIHLLFNASHTRAQICAVRIIHG